MRNPIATLTLTLVLLMPTGNAAAVFTPAEATDTLLAELTAYVDSDVNVYDYTTIGTAWTPLIIATVAEFNAVSPLGAPELVYVTASGDADCLDLPDDVWELTGIIVCDTNRPQDFPYEPNAPADGWSGTTQERDENTTVIALNNVVPAGFYRPYEEDDNTICHELMHAYTRADDAYDTDLIGSCVWGDLLAPGPTDVRLMQERYPVTFVDSSPTDEEPSLWERTKSVGRKVGERVCAAIPHVDISVLWEDTKSTGREVRERVSEVIPDVEGDLPGVDIGFPDIDIDTPDVDMPECPRTARVSP